MTGASALATDFTDANLTDAQLGGARLIKAKLDGANLTGAQVAGADLSGASLRRAILIRVDFSFATVEGADLSDVLRAPPAVFYVDELPLAEVLAAHETYCNSAGRAGVAARLCAVDFRPVVSLKRRKLSGLVAPGSVLFGMDLEGVELQGADLHAATCGAPTCGWPTCAAHG